MPRRMEEPAAIRLRTTTSIGEDFLLAIHYLLEVAPDALDPGEVKAVQTIVESMKAEAQKYGYIGYSR